MQIGMIGLGRMGANIVRRLLRAGHSAVMFDRDRAPGQALANEGAAAAASLADVAAKLSFRGRSGVATASSSTMQPTIDALIRPNVVTAVFTKR